MIDTENDSEISLVQAYINSAPHLEEHQRRESNMHRLLNTREPKPLGGIANEPQKVSYVI